MEKKETIQIEGMHCASCVASVEKSLKTLDGVKVATVNLATESAFVEYEEDILSNADLKKAVEDAGYGVADKIPEETAGDTPAVHDKDQKKTDLARRSMWFAWSATIPMVLWMLPEMIAGYHFLGPVGFNLGMVVLSALVLFGPGRGTLRSAWKSATHRMPNMDVLISIGTLASLATGVVAILHQFGLGPAFANFAGLAGMIMAFHLTGRYVETKAKGRASQAIKKLLTLEAKDATVIRNGEQKKIPIHELEIGDIMFVRPGEKIPTDGVVVDGTSSVDESLATGESMPVDKNINDEAIGATINKNGALQIRATKVGKDTFLSQVIRLVEEAQGSKIPIQAFADRVTSIFVPIVILTALLTLSAWLVFPGAFGSIAEWAAGFLPWVNPEMGSVPLALFAAIAVLVIACPCALGLATPTALMVGSGMGAENGILIRRGAAIQTMKDVNTIILDKTGTITQGKPGVTDIISLNGESKADILKAAASVESNSEHPLGQAIVTYAKIEGIQIASAIEFQSVTGGGVRATVESRRVLVGTEKMLSSSGVGIDAKTGDLRNALEEQGKTVMLVSIDEKLTGLIGVADRVKEDSRSAIRALKDSGMNPVMITGDNERTARAIAAEVGVDRIIANVLPEDKAVEVKRLQDSGETVAMVGDGINDAPALTQADVGIAIGTGTDIAIESGDIVLVRGELSAVVKAVRLSKATFKKIRQNLFWAFFYNVVMVPLAIIGVMHPVLAEIAMALSSINVVTNSRRLQRQRIQPPNRAEG